MKPSVVHRTAWLTLLALGFAGSTHAFVVNIKKGNEAVYLRVGDGEFNGFYSDNPAATPVNSTYPANVVSVSVPAANVGDGSMRLMGGTSRPTSDYEGYGVCNAGQTYIGGFYRGDKKGGTAVLTATVTKPLTNATGETIAFSRISWTSSGNGPDGAIVGQPVPGGSFNGGTQALAGFPVNTWRESCHTFSYANVAVVAAGTYTGTVTYTLTSP